MVEGVIHYMFDRYIPRDSEVEQYIEDQVAEDTCVKHAVFCCPQCFDVLPVQHAVRVA